MKPTSRELARDWRFSRELVRVFRSLDEVEKCALIFRVKDRWELKIVPNIHPDPENHMRVSVRDVLLEEAKMGVKALAILHTHCFHHTHQPSEDDLLGLRSFEVGFVYHPSSRFLTEYNREGQVGPAHVIRPRRLTW
jgi:hypothetical protein